MRAKLEQIPFCTRDCSPCQFLETGSKVYKNVFEQYGQNKSFQNYWQTFVISSFLSRNAKSWCKEEISYWTSRKKSKQRDQYAFVWRHLNIICQNYNKPPMITTYSVRSCLVLLLRTRSVATYQTLDITRSRIYFPRLISAS